MVELIKFPSNEVSVSLDKLGTVVTPTPTIGYKVENDVEGKRVVISCSSKEVNAVRPVVSPDTPVMTIPYSSINKMSIHMDPNKGKTIGLSINDCLVVKFH